MTEQQEPRISFDKLRANTELAALPVPERSLLHCPYDEKFHDYPAHPHWWGDHTNCSDNLFWQHNDLPSRPRNSTLTCTKSHPEKKGTCWDCRAYQEAVKAERERILAIYRDHYGEEDASALALLITKGDPHE